MDSKSIKQVYNTLFCSNSRQATKERPGTYPRHAFDLSKQGDIAVRTTVRCIKGFQQIDRGAET